MKQNISYEKGSPEGDFSEAEWNNHVRETRGHDIIYRSHDKWISNPDSGSREDGLIMTRVPYPTKTTEVHDNKDGEPLLIPTSLLHHFDEKFFSRENKFEDDLKFFKVMLVNQFETPADYFDYLDQLTPEEFYTWIDNIPKGIYEKNAHWVDFIKNVLKSNGINYDLLATMQYERVNMEKVDHVEYFMNHVPRMQSSYDLVDYLLAFSKYRILDNMIGVHEKWRIENYNIKPVKKIWNGLLVNRVEAIKYGHGKMFKSIVLPALQDITPENPELFTSENILARINEARYEFERNPKNSAFESFFLIVEFVDYIGKQLKSFKGDDSKIQVLEKVMEELLGAVKKNMNTEPLDILLWPKKRGEAIKRYNRMKELGINVEQEG